MKSIKKSVKFKSLSLPEPLFEEMKNYVKKSPNYRTMAEFLRVAIREKMRQETDFMKGAKTYLNPSETNNVRMAVLEKEIKEIKELLKKKN